MRATLIISAMVLAGTPCVAQTSIGTIQHAMVWGAVFGDHRIAPKTSLYWDYQARRAEAGAVWQLNLGAVGITRDLSAQWRATAALGWSRGYRYGALAPRTNTVEMRPWVQLTGVRAVRAWRWSDRTRVEFRAIRQIGEFARADADWAPTVVRVRRQDRFEHGITADRRWYGAAAQEFLVNVHPARSRVAMLEQSRTQFLLGRQLTPKNRLESGYGLQFWNRRGGNEMNHTLLLYFRTSVPFR